MNLIPHSKPWITEDDVHAVHSVLKKGMIGQGELVKTFESQIGRWVGSPQNGVAVGSGSAAVLLALKAVGCCQNDEIILPTYTCHTILEAILSTGATPVLCDAGKDWVMHADQIGSLVTPKLKAIIIPHMYGIYADVESFRRFKVPLIEDCAQAVFGPMNKPMIGDMAVFSFHPTKCLTTSEGGMVVAADSEMADKLRLLRDGDQMGGRQLFSPMSDLAAALGISQLSRYTVMLHKRLFIAAQYKSILRTMLPAAAERLDRLQTMYFRFPLTVAGGLSRYQQLFFDKGIVVRKGVDRLLHRLLNHPDIRFPESIRLFNETVSLPIYPALTDDELGCCLDAMKEIFASQRQDI